MLNLRSLSLFLSPTIEEKNAFCLLSAEKWTICCCIYTGTKKYLKTFICTKIVNVPTWGGCTKMVSSLTTIFLTPLSCRSLTARLMSSNSVCMSARVSFSPSSKHTARVLRCLPVNLNCKMILGVLFCKQTLRRTQNSMAQSTPFRFCCLFPKGVFYWCSRPVLLRMDLLSRARQEIMLILSNQNTAPFSPKVIFKIQKHY